MEQHPAIGIIVIGAGRYALKAHLPAIAARASVGDLKLIALVDFEKHDNPAVYEEHVPLLNDFLTRHGLYTTPWIYVPDKWKQSPPEVKDVAAHLNPQIGLLVDGFEKIAVVVSTSATAHKPYLEWALGRGFHVLADKPLTVPARCAIEASQATKILTDYKQLVKAAQSKKLLFMLATQKRYSSVFTKLAKRIRSIQMVGSTVPVTSVTYETNDGYWMFATDEYPDRFVGPYGSDRFTYHPAGGGGKVSHTGYHILDIIPWLIRHGGPSGIDNAVVYASFWRPQDSFTTFPLRRDGDGRFSFVPEDQRMNLSESLEGLSEVNAQVQIAFRSGKQKRCQVMINLLHEGISGSGEHGPSRVKYEQMNLHQGPAAAASFRRLARLDRDAARKDDLGGDNHVELLFLNNTHIVGGNAVETVRVKEENDGLPAEEFFRVLVTKTSPATAQVVSPLSDHSLGIGLMAAVYKSAISEFTAGAHFPHPIQVQFKNPESWRTPNLPTRLST